jgi:purine-nucleoside phosphorylase
MINRIKETAEFLKRKIVDFQPEIGIILGTGLGSLVNDIDVKHSFSYDEIPNFPVSTVEEHAGKLIFGLLENKPVVVMQGRFHYYEGYSMTEVTFPVRVLKLLGINNLFVSNAAGGINPQFKHSDLMLINDHINLLPENPLVGKNIDELGPRWPDMFNAYDKELVEKGLKIAKEEGISAYQGVYASVPGPNLETPAEYKYLSVIGADAVGMSTVPEIIVARHMGIPCFAVSVITDLCYPEAIEPCSIEKIIAAASKAEPKMTLLFKQLIKQL